MENINSLINSIIQISFNNLPIEEGWLKYEIDVSTIEKYTEMNAVYFTGNKEETSFNPKYQGSVDKAEDLTFIFKDLRKQMYELSPDKGAWFSCKITVFPSGKFITNFNYDENPNFIYKPSKEEYINELKKYPREASAMPDWLNKITN